MSVKYLNPDSLHKQKRGRREYILYNPKVQLTTDHFLFPPSPFISSPFIFSPDPVNVGAALRAAIRNRWMFPSRLEGAPTGWFFIWGNRPSPTCGGG
jgi:hypothetical protein